MKKVLCYLTALTLMFMGCQKDASSDLYEGIFLKGNLSCPNKIEITKSSDKNLPVHTVLNVGKGIQADDGQTVQFLISRYTLDTAIHNALCTYGQYDAIVILSNE